MNCSHRGLIGAGLLALLALPLTGCGPAGITEGMAETVPAHSGPPDDVKAMEKDMLRQQSLRGKVSR